MRLAHLFSGLPDNRLPAVAAALVLSLGVACGGGAPAQQPTAAPSPASAEQPSPSRPALASPVASPAASPAAVAKPSASAEGGQTYSVESGDTLLSIAEKVYGDATKWRQIYDANKDVIGDNPDALKIDMKLRIPPKN